MTTTPTNPTPVGRSGRPRPRRGEGQWALGYREPLNKNEQSKKDDSPLNARDRIHAIYSKKGFDSIDPADMRGRFRWHGLYTQRAPGFDGGKTAMLEEEELDDRYFMMRIRSDGALLDPHTIRTLGQISVEFARGTASRSKTCPPSGSASMRWASPRCSPAATRHAPSWVRLWRASPRTRSSMPRPHWPRSSGVR